MSRNPGRRLLHHDYSAPGWYSVTLVVEGRRSILGRVRREFAQLSPLGKVVHLAWDSVSVRWPWVQCRQMVIMPDHVHALVGWQSRPEGRDVTLGRFVGRFKAEAINQAVAARLLPSWDRLWQEGFWDRVIRSARELDRVERYVRQNPAKAGLLATGDRSAVR